jgi:hypothetical protein
MRQSAHGHFSVVLSIMVFAVVSAALGTLPVVAAEQSGLELYRWLDVQGRALPFQDHESILDALRTAPVVQAEPVGRGVAAAQKLTLELDGVRFHAVFRTVDETTNNSPPYNARRPMESRDAAVFEVAAYELSELLGLGRVPPAVVREIDGRKGSVQIWMEATRPEVELVQENALLPPSPPRYLQQKQIMDVFDSLIGNTDRNQGNLLIDQHWNIWLIDHTRAFRQSSELVKRDDLTACERRLWESLRSLDESRIRARVEPYLKGREISNLLTRWRKVVKLTQKLIEEKGEDAVLFDLSGPTASSSD